MTTLLSPTVKTNVSECSICCEIVPHKIFECPNCRHLFCASCQKRYEKDTCINCHMKFRYVFILEHIGKSFWEKTIKPHIIEELMKQQKETLKLVQPMVEWEKEYRKHLKNLRFGIANPVPPRPKILNYLSQNQVFPCPSETCRGFVENGICGLCQTVICLKCHEKYNDGHACKLEDLQSLATLMTDSRRCPKCCALIHRTQGCDHMYCTNCHTHFNWVTLQVLENSSNGHYLNLQRFAENIPTRDTRPTCTAQEYSLTHDLVAINTLKQRPSPTLVRCLWEDTNTIRMITKSRYEEGRIEQEYTANLQESQIKYLMNEIDEKMWQRLTYQSYRKYTFALLHAQILRIYLSTIDTLQFTIQRSDSDSEHNQDNQEETAILSQYTELVRLCNESFQSVVEEYGGKLHHIREPKEEIDVPPFS